MRSVQARLLWLPLSSASSTARSSDSCASAGSRRDVVDVGHLQEHAGLEVGAADALGDLELLVRELFHLGEVALPPARYGNGLESVEPAHVVARVDHSSACVRELARADVVGVAIERDLGESRQRPAPRSGCRRPRARARTRPPSPWRPPECRSSARRRGPPGSGARASARDRRPAAAGGGLRGSPRVRGPAGPRARAPPRRRHASSGGTRPSSSRAICAASSRW